MYCVYSCSIQKVSVPVSAISFKLARNWIHLRPPQFQAPYFFPSLSIDIEASICGLYFLAVLFSRDLWTNDKYYGKAKNKVLQVADHIISRFVQRTHKSSKRDRRRSIVIQNASLELNVRDWTPGVEPCAETKSSRHCHLGRDSRFLYPLASLHCIFHFARPSFPLSVGSSVLESSFVPI